MRFQMPVSSVLTSEQVLNSLTLSYTGSSTLSDSEKGREVGSKPDFVLHAISESPAWENVEFLFEHTRSFREAVTMKFLQWLRGAWSVFHHQPFHRQLYGIMFLSPCAYICYADHGCAVYSEPLYFVENIQHTLFLIEFLSAFIANPERRGQDPAVKITNNSSCGENLA